MNDTPLDAIRRHKEAFMSENPTSAFDKRRLETLLTAEELLVRAMEKKLAKPCRGLAEMLQTVIQTLLALIVGKKTSFKHIRTGERGDEVV